MDEKIAKLVQKYYVDCIDLLINRMRFDGRIQVSIGDLLNVKDKIKNKSFINALTKEPESNKRVKIKNER